MVGDSISRRRIPLWVRSKGMLISTVGQIVGAVLDFVIGLLVP